MADVFISYKKEERERAYAIAVNLETLLVSTWLDAQLSPGQSFSEEIRTEIDRCKAQVVCWSTAATGSEWVSGEAEIGRKRGVLVPVFIERCELLPPFNMLHAEDLTTWDGRSDHPGWLAVLRKLGTLLGRPGLSDLGRLIGSTDVVAWKAWIIRYPGDPGETIAGKFIGNYFDIDPPSESSSSRPETPREPSQRSITELQAELQVADFRLRVFRDAAKKFGWKDSKEEQRLEIEVAAIREALTRHRFGASEETPPKQPLSLRIKEFVNGRNPVEKFGLAAMAAVAAFAVGFIALALLSIPVRMAQSNSAQQTNETTLVSPSPAVVVPAPIPFDMTLLGPSADSTLFNQEFEAIGDNPMWAMRFSDEHAILQFRDGTTHDSYQGQREVRSRGAQTIYQLGEPLAVVIVRQRCSLASGVTTEFELHVRSSVATYDGCATPVRSEHWPPWDNYGSQFWRFERRPFDD